MTKPTLLTGPELLSGEDFARVCTEVTGKPVQYVTPDEATLTSLQLLICTEGALANDEGRAIYQSICGACRAPENAMVSSPKAGDTAEWSRRLPKGLEAVTDNAVNGFRGHAAQRAAPACFPASRFAKRSSTWRCPGNEASAFFRIGYKNERLSGKRPMARRLV